MKYECRQKIFKAQSQPSPQGFASQGYYTKWLSNRTGSAGSWTDVSLSILHALFQISSWESESGEEPQEPSLHNDLSAVPTPARAPCSSQPDHPAAASWTPWESILQARCLCLNCLLAQVFLMNSNLPLKPAGMGRYWCSVSNKHMTYLSQVSNLLAQTPKVTPLPWLRGKYFSSIYFLWGHHSRKGVVHDPRDHTARSAS